MCGSTRRISGTASTTLTTSTADRRRKIWGENRRERSKERKGKKDRKFSLINFFSFSQLYLFRSYVFLHLSCHLKFTVEPE